jgi:Protein of unknown function (DUF4199)
METKSSTQKFGLDNGIYYGLVMILSFVLIYALNIDVISNPLIGTVSSIFNYFVFPVLFIFLAINAFKKSNQGFASLGECLKTGVTVAFVAAILLSVFSVIFNLTFPEYQEEMFNQTRKIMMRQNPTMTSDQLEASLGIMKKFSSPLFTIPIMVLTLTFMGLIYSLIIGAILKKERSIFN